MARPSFFTAAGWRAHQADVAAFHAERLAAIALEPLQGNNHMSTITRSPGIPTGHMGLVAGGGMAGATEELDSAVQAAAEALVEAFPGRDVVIRFNSNRMSGGAWLVTHPVDSFSGNAEIGICAGLYGDRAVVDSIFYETICDPAARRRKLDALPRTLQLNVHIGKKSSPTGRPDYTPAESIPAAIAYLKANAIPLVRYA